MKNRRLIYLLALMLAQGCVAVRADEPAKPKQEEPAKPQPAAVPGEYRVNAGDVLEISVWKEEGLTKEVRVRPDGGISFPLVGDLQVQGLTVDAITGQVIERLNAYLSEPVVTVAVRESNQRFYVTGKVNKPGDIVSPNRLSVMQALSMAGGLSTFADQDDITVIHRVGNKTVSLNFDYASVANGEDLEQNITLEPGDVVVVH